MTFLEKAKNDLKDKEFLGDGLPCKCPCKYGYEKEYSCSGVECEDCWNREMPNTEPKADGIPVIPQSEVDAWHNAHESGKAEGYEQGLNDAWELYRKAGEMSDEDYDRCFVLESCEGLTDLSPQEALAKLKAYEEAQEIKLGEIVIVNIPDEKGIVIVECQDGEYKVLMEDFDIVKLPASKLTKTGRFVALNNIIEQIGE
jgi:hypothetical protein